MARYKGRVIVSKVDSKGVKIKGSLATWIKKHPEEEYFDSLVEQQVWRWLKAQKTLKVESKKSIELFAPASTTEFVKGEIKKRIIRSISYTPDFYLPDYDVYIEVKGWADPVFRLRWKLFKFAGYNGYIVYSLLELQQLLKKIKLYYKK